MAGCPGSLIAQVGTVGLRLDPIQTDDWLHLAATGMAQVSRSCSAPLMSHVHEQNRRSWNAVTEAHNSHKRDQSTFFREGGSTLFPEEVELLGPASGTLLHLQCNCGQDSLSLARLGFSVTGVDISDEAIKFAADLSRDSGVAAAFQRADVLQWLPQAAARGQRYDRVMCSYGTIGWIENLQEYFHGVASVLSADGAFVLMEFHPLVWSLGPDGDPYFLDKPISEAEGVQDYVGRSGPGLTPSGWEDGIQNFANPERAVSFQWTVADILQALIDAQLRLEVFREFPYSNGCLVFEGMNELPGKRFEMPTGQPSMPLMLGLRARRGAS